MSVSDAADRYALISGEPTNVLATAPGSDRSAVCGRFGNGCTRSERRPAIAKAARKGAPRMDYVPTRQDAATEAFGRPVRRRRGGTAVESAIFDAVIAELAEVGFGRLTFEGVAERAGTGKSPLYRRWPDTTSLVIDTLEKLAADPSGYRRTGVLRDDVIGLTVHMTKTLHGVRGEASRSLLGEAHRYPPLLARFMAQVLDPLFETLTDLLRDAAGRGEISPERLTPVLREVLPPPIARPPLLGPRSPTKKDVTEMFDQVFLPLLVR